MVLHSYLLDGPYATFSSIQIEGKVNQVSYLINVNFDHIHQTHAELVYKNLHTRCPVEWTFPILSKQKFYKYLVNFSSFFTIQIDQLAQIKKSIKVRISSNKIEKEVKKLFEELNRSLFAHNQEILKIWLKRYKKSVDEDEFKGFLFKILENSKNDLSCINAAANGITLLNLMNVSFSYRNLSKIRIPGADLSHANLNDTDLSWANLKRVRLTKAQLLRTNLSGANLSEVVFDIHPGLQNPVFLENFSLKKKKLSNMSFLIRLKGEWQENHEEGKYKIILNTEHIRQTQATLTLRKRSFDCPVEWNFPVLSKQELKEDCLSLYPSLSIYVERREGSFNILIASEKFEKQSQQILDELNEEIFSHNFSRLQFWKDIYNQADEETKEEYVKFLFKILKKSGPNFNESKIVAATNAITLLNLFNVPLSHLDLGNISICWANLCGTNLEGTNLVGADLRGVQLENACLIGTRLTGTDLSNVSLNILPFLKHEKRVLDFSLSSNDQYLVAKLEGNDFVIWDLSQFVRLINLSSGDFKKYALKSTQSCDLSFLTDKQIVLFFHSDKKLSFWRLNGAENAPELEYISLLQLPHPNLLFSPNKKWMSNWSTQECCIFEVHFQDTYLQLTEKRKFKCQNGSNFCFSFYSNALAFTENLKRNRITVLNKKFTQKEQWETDLKVENLQFTNDHLSLLGVSGNQIWKWTVSSLDLPIIYFESHYLINQLEYIARNKLEVCYLYTTKNNLIGIWNASLQQEICRILTYMDYTKIRVSHNGELIFASSGDTSIAVWKTEHLTQQTISLDGPIKNFYFSHDSRFIFSLPDSSSVVQPYLKQIQDYNYPNPNCLNYVMNRYSTARGRDVSHSTLAISLPVIYPKKMLDPLVSDDKLFFIYRLCSQRMFKFGNFKRFCLWNIEENKEYWTYSSSLVISAFALNMNSLYAAFLYLKEKKWVIEVWDTQRNVQLIILDISENISSQTSSFHLTMSSFKGIHGYLALIVDTDVVIIQLLKYKRKMAYTSIQTIKRLHIVREGKFCYRRKQNFFFTLTKGENLLRVWDFNLHRSITILNKNKKFKEILCFDIFSDGSFLVFVTKDQKLFLWDILNEREVCYVNMYLDMSLVKISPDGKTVATYDEKKKTLYLWKIENDEFSLLWMTPKRFVCQGADISGAQLDPQTRSLFEQLLK